MTDPHEPGGISVTIKGDEPGGKYNDAKTPGTWVVFHGSPAKIKQQIIEFFEFGEAEAARPLYDLVNEATSLFKAAANASRTLGAKAVLAGPSGPSQDGTIDPTSSDVWAQAQGGGSSQPAQPVEEPKDQILTALESCQTVADVQQVWAENQQAFAANAAYMDAYKARGKALVGK